MSSGAHSHSTVEPRCSCGYPDKPCNRQQTDCKAVSYTPPWRQTSSPYDLNGRKEYPGE
mgnify:CR=1 FL=1